VNAEPTHLTLHVKPEGQQLPTGNRAAQNIAANRQYPVMQKTDRSFFRDGETIAIGGLITENINKSTTGIPLLMFDSDSRIPVQNRQRSENNALS